MNISKKFISTNAKCIGLAMIMVVSMPGYANDEKYDAAVENAEAVYDAAKAKCDLLSGNAEDVCIQEAKAQKVKTEADAKAAHKSSDAKADATEDKLEAEYKAAKEKCDDLSGDVKDSCIATAKATYHQ